MKDKSFIIWYRKPDNETYIVMLFTEKRTWERYQMAEKELLILLELNKLINNN